ncbi:chromatin target of PRMT1 protein-like isoform X3 [Gambusia affinis]|uniref:chromatin target of PRMT1 protein-like isoform X3 n=1 Tax=Gambusia affinis TaxID=33528 RepID=UPI001CDC5E5C|nr:chromatin target of PRMT1 protein-like isoform X3 [Gambusia affinis]
MRTRLQRQSLMEPARPGPLYLRSTATVSLNERFSQLLMTRRTRPGRPGFRSRRRRAALVQAPPTCQKRRLRVRGSVWTRLGGPLLTRGLTRRRWSWRQSGFWSFRRKYTWRGRCSAPYRRRGNQLSRLGQRRLVETSDLQNQTEGGRGPTLRRGGATASKGRGLAPKQQLDAELDEYMSLSRSRLDRQLDDYMSMSRRRLDQEMDEYMLMAGQCLED